MKYCPLTDVLLQKKLCDQQLYYRLLRLKKPLFQTCWLAFIVLLLCACVPKRLLISDADISTDITAFEFNSELFGLPQKTTLVEEIYRLNSDQTRAFYGYFEDPDRQHLPAHQRVSDYLKAVTNHFNYQGNTYPAEEALANASGNCLSLAILTTALAKLAKVETGYQLIDSTPVFESQGDVIYKGLHVRSILYSSDLESNKGYARLSRKGIRIDYYPSHSDRFVSNLNRSQYIAMFYSNQAAEAIAENNHQKAFWLLRRSLEIDPLNPGAMNMMAVVYRRAGDEDYAEKIYQYGIKNLPHKVSFLRNYRILLKQQGRYVEAAEVTETLKSLNDPSPFDWYRAGQMAYQEGDFSDAISYYKKTLRLAPYLHEAYLGMAKAYYEMGNLNAAERELKSALERTHRHSTQSLYKAKLMALQGS